ncbi:tRNA pseudouridine(13) synthase TruD [Halocalculus aciditolerans]|uniref:Probable tRNA pseudouridine synthase D n=1 Tax=Halocalculus aciditolerans TaxID=1383812 RepID=A0A830FFW4_9EURY|nr:tRNA pseudouridine(13) synthase TruD [Halocalculus aciditolerans]GGL70608.1 tRNA pseudouridine(13) synthase TruD [Halocalculus aciditolerans]
MRDAHPIEREVGMEYYVSEADGVGGRLRASADDFRVEEVEDFQTQPVDADPGDYPHLVVRATLTDWDTNGFARELANRLSMSRERVSWAGTKDKNAVTTQLFSLRGVDAGDLPEVLRADVEAVGRAGRALEFGDLAGNRFEIVVRDPEQPENAADIGAELEAFGGGTGAVPNYFGQQRFGSYRPVTHEVGLHVVRGEWRAAVLAYIANPSEHEPARTRGARRAVADAVDAGDPAWGQLAEDYPGHLRYERTVLNKLAENGGESADDFEEALETFPSNLQRLFVHAAQSYVFNRILSTRLERGLPFHEPVEGDVVAFADRDAPDGMARPDVDRLQHATGKRVETMQRHCARGRAFVTAPLVGYETEFADGEPGEITKSVLADLDLEREMFELPGSFDSSGTRRAVLVHAAPEVTRDPLAFDFTLPSGSYATVVLREYLKRSPLDL